MKLIKRLWGTLPGKIVLGLAALLLVICCIPSPKDNVAPQAPATADDPAISAGAPADVPTAPEETPSVPAASIDTPTVTADTPATPAESPAPDPAPAAPEKIHGVAADTIVYVSDGGKIHKIKDCSGMKNYTEMKISSADGKYDYCAKCW